MGKQVKNTVIKRKNFRPHKSDKPPINGALKKDKNPCLKQEINYKILNKLLINKPLHQE